jgi:hypothetical protein
LFAALEMRTNYGTLIFGTFTLERVKMRPTSIAMIPRTRYEFEPTVLAYATRDVVMYMASAMIPDSKTTRPKRSITFLICDQEDLYLQTT